MLTARVGRWWRQHRRAGAAVVGSLLVHLGFWALWARVPLPGPAPAADAIEIEVRATPDPPAPPAGPAPSSPRAEEQVPPRPPRTPRKEAPKPPPSDDRGRAAAEAPGSKAEDNATVPKDEAGASAGAATGEVAVGGARPLPEGIFLAPGADQLARAGIDLAPPVPATPPKGPRRWERDMARLARQAAARANVRAGKAPPEVFELLREIERRYTPSHKLVAELARAEAGKARSTGRWVGRYLGGFLDHDPTEKDQPFTREQAFNRAMKNAGLEFETRMCVSFAADGTPVVEHDGGSNVPSLDKLARELVVQAAERRRPGLASAGSVRACFRFSAKLTRVPPIPIISFGLDENWRPVIIYPLKELASTRVELEGVELEAQAINAR